MNVYLYSNKVYDAEYKRRSFISKGIYPIKTNNNTQPRLLVAARWVIYIKMQCGNSNSGSYSYSRANSYSSYI